MTGKELYEEVRRGCEDIMPKEWDSLTNAQRVNWEMLANRLKMAEAEVKSADAIIGKIVRLNPDLLPVI